MHHQLTESSQCQPALTDPTKKQLDFCQFSNNERLMSEEQEQEDSVIQDLKISLSKPVQRLTQHESRDESSKQTKASFLTRPKDVQGVDDGMPPRIEMSAMQTATKVDSNMAGSERFQ